MAKLLLYSIKDSRVGLYEPPFAFSHEGQATRFWTDVVNDPEKRSAACRYPNEFALHKIGEFDSETGEVLQESPPVFVAFGTDVFAKNQPALPLAPTGRES